MSFRLNNLCFYVKQPSQMGETVEQACGSINAVDDAYNVWFISINGENYAENITSAVCTHSI